MTKPLDGIRILDFTRVLAGPHCTKILQDLGASVVKVEPPGGDLGRLSYPITGGTSHFFAQQNAGKRNISIDLNFEEGRKIALQLAEQADIVVENFRPGTLDYFGLDYKSVSKLNPRVIYGSISGYGQEGPWKDRAGFAPTVQAEIGYTKALLEYYDRSAVDAIHDLFAHGDTYAGLHATIGILAALQQRSVTGKGQHVDVAMAAMLLYVNERFNSQAHEVDTEGEPVSLGSAESPIITLADGTMVTIAASPIFSALFGRFCSMMRRTDLLDDPRFATAHLRRKNHKDLLEVIRTWMLTFNEVRDLETQVRVSGLALGVLRTTKELLDTPWSEHRKPVVEIDDGVGGKIKVPKPAWLFSDADLDLPTRVARRGQDNAEVLSELGWSTDEIAELSAKRVLLSESPRSEVDAAANSPVEVTLDQDNMSERAIGSQPAAIESAK